jgi:hypothetical protein
MGATIAKIYESSNEKVELLSIESSSIEAIRNCPPEILARIASFLGQRECKRIGEFFPEMEDAFELAKDMNWEWCCFFEAFFIFENN